MADKLIGGTPVGNRSLCATCRFSQVMRGLNMQEQTYCLRLGRIPPLITFPVEKYQPNVPEGHPMLSECLQFMDAAEDYR